MISNRSVHWKTWVTCDFALVQPSWCSEELRLLRFINKAGADRWYSIQHQQSHPTLYIATMMMQTPGWVSRRWRIVWRCQSLNEASTFKILDRDVLWPPADTIIDPFQSVSSTQFCTQEVDHHVLGWDCLSRPMSPWQIEYSEIDLRIRIGKFLTLCQ